MTGFSFSYSIVSHKSLGEGYYLTPQGDEQLELFISKEHVSVEPCQLNQ